MEIFTSTETIVLLTFIIIIWIFIVSKGYNEKLTLKNHRVSHRVIIYISESVNVFDEDKKCVVFKSGVSLFETFKLTEALV